MHTPLIGPDSLEVDAVVPQCLDNQYVSDAVFAQMLGRGVDYTDAEIAKRREQDFRSEFIRSLVYSSQVVIQRAFFKNSDFLYKNYLPEQPENLAAFAALVRDRVIVPYLMNESSLRDELTFDVRKDGERATSLLLDEIGDVPCVRLSVDDAANERLCAAMYTRFGSRLTELTHLNESQRNAMAAELFADPGRLQQDGAWRAFDDTLDRFARYAFDKSLERRKKDGQQLTRQDVYLDNFAAPGDSPEKTRQNVVLGRFRKPDVNDPFLFELKKFADLVYNVNLPDYLRRYTFTPATLPTRMALQDAPKEGYRHEQLASVLSNDDALEAIRVAFMANAQRAMSLPLLHELTVADVLEIRRDLPEWEKFKSAQVEILEHPLRCLELLERFQADFDEFQRALSEWYNRKYERRRTEERYTSYVSLALSIGGKLILAGADLEIGAAGKIVAGTAVDRLLANIPKKVKGYAAKLMVGVYDVGRQQLDAQRTYSIELMQTSAEMTREDVIDLLQVVSKAGADTPAVTAQLADQGTTA